MTNAMSHLVTAQVLSKRVLKVNTDVKGIWHDMACYWNAEFNRVNAFKSLSLKRVCGSIAFCNWFEYGGIDYNLKKFQTKPNDSHCWLEDADGNVYDYVQPSWLWFAKTNGHDGKMPLGIELRGVSKDSLRAQNLWYVPASNEVQKFLLAWADKGSSYCSDFDCNIPWWPQPIDETIAGF